MAVAAILSGEFAASSLTISPIFRDLDVPLRMERELHWRPAMHRLKLPASRLYPASGFSLVEVIVATSVFVVGAVGLAPLFLLASRSTSGAHVATYAAVLAQEKMEQLRALRWGFDALGLPVADTATDTTVVPEAPTGGTGLRPSPGGALSQNTSGYCDFLDVSGRSLGGGATPPIGTAYVRRWSIEPLPTNPTNTIVIQVLVAPPRSGAAAGFARAPGQARIVSLKTRKAS